jgi:hypothetical protein
MALVQLSDVVIPAVYETYTAVNSPETTLFFQSGVAVTNEALLAAFDGGGNVADLPFWNDLDDSAEPNYSTDNPSDVAVGDLVTTGKMTTRVSDMNKIYTAANLVVDLAGSDPMQQIRNRFGTWWMRQWQHRLIAMMTGLLNANVAQNSGDMVENVSIAAGNSATAANLIGGTAFVNALYNLGDRAANITAVAVHSVVMSQLVKNDMITFFKPSQDAPAIPTMMGKVVIMDDSLPVVPGATNGFVYTSILFGHGAIGYAEGVPTELPVQLWNEPFGGNGAGITSLIERKRLILHPFGYQFTSASVAGQSPTNAEMATAANWSRVVVRKNVPITFLVTNG